MMKKIIATLLTLGILAPSLALAETTPRGNLGTEGANFCTRIENISGEISTKFGTRLDKRGEHEDKRDTNIQNRFDTRDHKLAEHRAQVDGNWTERYTKLDERATTDAEKAAVAAFKTAMDAALVTRRAAVDAALKAYRDGVNSLVSTRQAAVDTAIAAFQASVNAALAQAKTDCANNVAPTTVRATFIAAVQAAQATLKTATSDGKIKDQVKALGQTRDAAVKAAMDAYKTAAQAALAALKAAFGSTN